LLDLLLLTTEIYHKVLQLMYKTIKEIDTIVVIIKYKLDEDKEELIEENEIRVRVMVKYTILNYKEVLPKYL